MSDYRLKHQSSTEEEAFQRTAKQCNTIFSETIRTHLQQAEQQKNRDQMTVIYLDKNFPPQAYSQQVVLFNQMQFVFSHIQLRMVALIPQITTPLVSGQNTLPFDL